MQSVEDKPNVVHLTSAGENVQKKKNRAMFSVTFHISYTHNVYSFIIHVNSIHVRHSS